MLISNPRNGWILALAMAFMITGCTSKPADDAGADSGSTTAATEEPMDAEPEEPEAATEETEATAEEPEAPAEEPEATPEEEALDVAPRERSRHGRRAGPGRRRHRSDRERGGDSAGAHG